MIEISKRPYMSHAIKEKERLDLNCDRESGDNSASCSFLTRSIICERPMETISSRMWH